ncbi:MAG: type I phosphomannose isomerase catalytic subunit [Bacteroidota bacterium]
MKTSNLYPLKFEPQLKEKVWGGTQLSEQFEKKAEGKIGESWEISGVQDSVSLVSNGVLAGKSLTELIHRFGSDLLGKDVARQFGNEFPLLFKFIDAKEDLSVQLHPDDTVAGERHNSFGKTEMWYVLHAEENARLILGFNQEMDKETYVNYLSKGKITQILNEVHVSRGDAFFIAPGTVHAIGAGVMLAEIQQTSDITYRIYDWDRPGMDGKMRELHTDLALDVIDFSRTDSQLKFTQKEDEETLICESPYFVTQFLKLSRDMKRDVSRIDSFLVYMCVDGEAQLNDVLLKNGETILIPACTERVDIHTQGATLLEVYIPGNDIK